MVILYWELLVKHISCEKSEGKTVVMHVNYYVHYVQITCQWWKIWRVKALASLWSASVWQTHHRSQTWWGGNLTRSGLFNKTYANSGLYVLMFFLQPSDVLSCPPDSVVSAVLSVLKICSGFSSPAACREVSRNVIGSSKVQKCALETLRALSNSTGKCACMLLLTSSKTQQIYYE